MRKNLMSNNLTCLRHGDPLVCLSCEAEDNAQPVWMTPTTPDLPAGVTEPADADVWQKPPSSDAAVRFAAIHRRLLDTGDIYGAYVAAVDAAGHAIAQRADEPKIASRAAVLDVYAEGVTVGMDLGKKLVKSPPPTISIGEIREGEENDGDLESTDLFLEGRGIALLINVLAGESCTFSLHVDGMPKQRGTVGRKTPRPAE